MADNKPDWIKLTVDMFDNQKIKYLRTLPEGNNLVLIWVMLLTMAGRCNSGGMIFLTQNIPYTPKMLADELKFEENTVILALQVFEQLGMIARDMDILMIPSWYEYQSEDGLEKIREQNKKRQQAFRDKQKLMIEEKNNVMNNVTDNVTVTHLSYSYSISNSNYINTNNILNIYKDKYMYINSNEDLLNSILEWMEYKDSLKPKSKHHYSTEMGLCKLLTQIQNKANENGIDYVVGNIDNSIAHTWIGITWLDEVKRVRDKNIEIKDDVVESINYGWKE